MAQVEGTGRKVVWVTMGPDLHARFSAFGATWAAETGNEAKPASIARALIVRALDAEERKARKKGGRS